MSSANQTARVEVWTISLLEPRELVLSAEEEVRAKRFRFDKHRLHWSRAHSALRQILGGVLGVRPLSIDFEFGVHGKPQVLGIQFNLSHTEDYAMIAVSRDAEVGIDIERHRPGRDIAKLLRRLGETELPEDAEGLYQRWTRREATSKARGGALFDAPCSRVQVVDVIAPAGHSAAVAAVERMPEVAYCGSGSG